MSQTDIQEIFKKASTDNDLQSQILKVLGEMSKEDGDFKRRLLSTLDDGLGKGEKLNRWLSPFSNLKKENVIQVVVSVILIVAFGAYVYLTFSTINTEPKPINMGDGQMEMFDPFVRAKDLLTLILPIFATVVSFWLGFSIQERKVNQVQQVADVQREMREKADKMMAKVEGRMMTTPENDDIKNLSNDIHKIMES